MNDSNIALAASAAAFISSYILLITIRPRWVHVELEDKRLVLAKEKVTLYSVLFGLIGGLAAVACTGMSRANRERATRLGFRFGNMRPEQIVYTAASVAVMVSVVSYFLMYVQKPAHVMEDNQVNGPRVLGMSALYGLMSLLFMFVYFEVFNLQA